MEDTRLIYIYDSNGTLINGKPFVGMKEFNLFMDRFHYKEDAESYRKAVRMRALSKCRPNGDMFLKHYFRTRPTTVFKSRVKFYTLKLKA